VNLDEVKCLPSPPRVQPPTLTTFTPLSPPQYPHLKAYYEKLAAHPKIVEAKERMATSPATTC